ncbi:MAG: 4Fe-4S dicluster domain-containing protein [Deltaproteobacteria bacterium]|jgi:Fe-S-cluster-containing hydrogenase component 2|nr:4Fe-4S dicluster domain-containing protein [Deltaproteobacteria bacterium]MBW1916315.1 4Fe-4S dicluster domain-containing protein [Deltaproteobacteria bacterium]MBW2182341.1 4Fe-4S dicluster domain-containing protein [Deltaproteobacteria bacterium]
MEKLLLFDVGKCTGCRTCEMACSLIQTGICNPANSRRRTLHFNEDILDVSMQCQQCDDPACMNTCPAEAIYVDDKTGAKIINYDKCIGCKMCSIACPFGAISVDPLTKRVVKCDMCSGDPACVKFCATGAIEYITADAYDKKRQRERIMQMKKIAGGGV